MAKRTSRLLLGMVILLLLAVALLGLSLWAQQRREQESSQLAVTVTQQGLSTGSAATLVSNAHPDLLAETSSADLDAYLGFVVRQLGELQSLQSITGTSTGGWLPGIGPPATASYEISLQFAMQPATAVVQLQQVAGDWQVQTFLIQSPALFQ